MRRPRRVESRYTAALTLAIEPEMKAAIEAEADAAELPVSGVTRDAIARGLPLVRDARRKRTRQSKQDGTGTLQEAGGPIPDDWTPSADVIKASHLEDFSDDAFRWLITEFRNDAKDVGRREADWDAAACRWIGSCRARLVLPSSFDR